jgi:hypothetical protein
VTTIEKYAKAIVGLLGVTTTVILATVPPNTALWTWASVVAGVLTVLGIGSVPNQYGVPALRAKLAEAERALEPEQSLSVMDEHPEGMAPYGETSGTVKVCTGGADCPVPGHTGVPHPPDQRRTW